MKELQEMWKQVLLKVEMMVSAVSFDLWIAPLEVLDYNKFEKLILSTNSAYAKKQLMKNHCEQLKSAIGEEFTAFIASMKTPIPKHRTSVPELFRYHEATKYFVMSIVREAYGKGLHLKDIDYCCPPVVLVYEE